MIERPQQGGSYVRDKQTGKLTRKEFTKPAEPQAAAQKPAPAPAATQPAEAKPIVKENGNA